MQGRIVQRSPGSWQLIYDLPRGADGKRKQGYVTIKGTKRDAEKELRKRLQEIDAGLVMDTAKGTMADHLHKWLATMKGKVEATTYEGLETVVRAHLVPYFGTKKLEAIKPTDVRDFILFLEERGSRTRGHVGEPLAGITVNRIGSVLKQALREAVDLGIIARNPAKVRLPPPTPQKKRVVTPEEITRLMQETQNSYLHTLILLGLATGLRRGELLGLKWSDVDLETGEVNISRSMAVVKEGKNGQRVVRTKRAKTDAAERTVFLPEFARTALRQQKGRQAAQRLACGPVWRDHDLIVCAEDGQPIRPSTASVRMKQMMDSLGLERVTLHGLRHTFASMAIASGANLLTLQKVMGHTSIKMTIGTYGHLMGGEQETVAHAMEGLLKDVVGF